jgi:hypothetical protein
MDKTNRLSEELAKVKKLTLQKAEALVASRQEKLKIKVRILTASPLKRKESQPIKSPKTPNSGIKKSVSATRVKLYEHSGKWVYGRGGLLFTCCRSSIELNRLRRGLAA